jgi:hypothetical protein
MGGIDWVDLAQGEVVDSGSIKCGKFFD